MFAGLEELNGEPMATASKSPSVIVAAVSVRQNALNISTRPATLTNIVILLLDF
jgi:hypothetical protein